MTELRARSTNCAKAESDLSYQRQLIQDRLGAVVDEEERRQHGQASPGPTGPVAPSAIRPHHAHPAGLGLPPRFMFPAQMDRARLSRMNRVAPLGQLGALQALSDADLWTMSGKLDEMEHQVAAQQEGLGEVLALLRDELVRRGGTDGVAERTLFIVAKGLSLAGSDDTDVDRPEEELAPAGRQEAAGRNEAGRRHLESRAASAERPPAADTASFDILTGAYRRDAGFVELDREIARARRTNQGLVLVYADVDGLEQVNDSRGHAAGDLVLRQVADALRSQMRSYDLVIRYEGDEFICVIPNVGLADVAARMVKVNAALAEASECGSVTVGLADLQPDESCEDLIGRADSALRQQRGRQTDQAVVRRSRRAHPRHGLSGHDAASERWRPRRAGDPDEELPAG